MITQEFKSKTYWEDRYKRGGNSGTGSYGENKVFKTKIINQIIDEYNIESMYDLGCGDGSQLEGINTDKLEYVGFDISDTVISKCKDKYPHLTFDNMDNINNYGRVQLTMSNDVIYHLIEDEVYDEYMDNLISKTTQYILIYSTNFDDDRKPTHV